MSPPELKRGAGHGSATDPGSLWDLSQKSPIRGRVSAKGVLSKGEDARIMGGLNWEELKKKGRLLWKAVAMYYS